MCVHAAGHIHMGSMLAALHNGHGLAEASQVSDQRPSYGATKFSIYCQVSSNTQGTTSTDLEEPW